MLQVNLLGSRLILGYRNKGSIDASARSRTSNRVSGVLTYEDSRGKVPPKTLDQRRNELHRVKNCFGSCLVSLALVAFAVPAHANISFNVTYGSSITSDPHAAAIEATINQAISFYEANITTPITVNIEYQEMNGGLGQSTTFFNTISYSQFLTALQTNSSGDAVDTSALANLPAGPDNPVNGNTQIDLTTANLRALGFSASVATDSTISINTSITNYTGIPYDSNNFSLLSVIEHETDEALGLGSNLDTGSTSGQIRPEDLFRYSAAGVRSYTTSSSATSYFSVDGGTTNLIGFNQVGPPGGSDYGDWATSATPHVQDAFGTPGASPAFSINEQDALDAIGYNFVSTPEPGSFWLLTLGAAAVLGWRRRAAN
jgi:hypothetical protein